MGSTTWTLAFTTSPGQRARLRRIAAGDLPGLQKEVLTAKARFGVPLDAPVRSCYEAGRDGLWLHQWLVAQGLDNVVVDSASIEVSRRARRAKQEVQDQGISTAGRAELRRVAIQVAWGWVRWQPDSAWTQWFTRRFAEAGGRSRRIGIVAVARKLVIALWRVVVQGVIPEGATLNAVA